MNKKKNVSKNAALKRVALYIRVSGEEQKVKGLSIESQRERLESYARERGWLIVGVYIDAAKSARKKLHKRVQFHKMLESVKRDEVDMLLFTRLDRWFRSVQDYYKVMEILDAHHCEWKTIDEGEGYDTSTSSGRLYINIKLSIAQNESDLDSERIGVVFDTKIAHGTVVSGACPMGYRVNEEKRLEIVPDQAEIVQDAFDFYEKNVTKRGTVRYIREKYGKNFCYDSLAKMLNDELYTGVYNRGGRYNPDFCPAIISRDQFDRVQDLVKRNARRTPTGHVYLFTSLLKCDECSHSLIGYYTNGHHYYKCNHHFQRMMCGNNRSIRENSIESWLLEHLADELDRCELEWKVESEKKKRTAAAQNKAAIRSKLVRLKELYVNELIDLDDYKKDYEMYTAALAQPDPEDDPAPDFQRIHDIVGNDFYSVYGSLSRVEKRTLWRSVIKEIRVDSNREITAVYFV